MNSKLLGLCLGVGLMAPMIADAAEVTLQVVGQPIQNVLHTKGELPFFNETLPEKTGGKVDAKIISADQLAISGPEVIRMLSRGAIEFGSGGLTQAAADSPKFEGCDLPGLTTSLEDARAACAAYRPVLEKELREKFGIKLLALGANPPQAIWCVKPITSLAELEGRKVRVYNQTLSDFVAGAGGTPVNIPYGDTVPALKTGVIDCAISGTLTGNTSKWFEVAQNIYPMSLGWAIQYWGANVKKWEQLPQDVQADLETAYAELEDKLWDIAAHATAQGIECNLGKDSCELGVKGSATVNPIAAEDEAKRKEILQESVLTAWAKRCGADCAAEWNNVMSDQVGLKAPIN
ncbi:TRAP transporter substrate-binding protein [Paracoccus jeotgali]|uniref:TRAP transporter substrate-binding protein n=1 Tax=Paracoccus jeotgali TaxID=2065379 RepID=UPI0028A7E882|nr:TRAP transporter substrate-binding protein [Paracoccus jeotgali]